MTVPSPHASGFWRRAFPAEYALIGVLDPLIRRYWRTFGLGNVVELELRGRRTGQPRRVLLGLLRDGHRWFLGHPNGDVAWTRNLEAAGGGELRFRGLPALPVRAIRLPVGELRDRAILATSQHPFPGNVIYRLARRHVLAAGTYFAIEPIQPD